MFGFLRKNKVQDNIADRDQFVADNMNNLVGNTIRVQILSQSPDMSDVILDAYVVGALVRLYRLNNEK